MLPKRFPHKTFSLLVMAVFVLQSFSPFAFAADPTPTPTSTITYPSEVRSGGTCTVNSISDDERETLWRNTVGKPITEMTDLPLESALQARSNVAEDFLNSAPEKAQGSATDPYFQQNIPLDQVAPFLVNPNDKEKFKDTKELLEAAGVQWDQSTEKAEDVIKEVLVSPAQLKQIGEKKRGTALETVNNILSQIGLGQKSGEKEAPTPTPLPYENKKISLPGGKTLTWSQFVASGGINPDSCLIDGVVKGNVGYVAVLDTDLAYGNLNNQLLTGELISAPTGEVDEELKDPLGKNQKIVGSRLRGFLNLNGGANVLIPSFYEYWLVAAENINSYQFALSLFAGVGAAGASKGIDEVRKLRLERLQSIDNELSSISRLNPADPAVRSALDARTSALLTQAQDIRDNIRFYDTYEGFWKRLQRSASPVLGSSLMIGFGWLGPARLLFSMNDGLIFDTTRNEDQYIKIFANRKIANRFREASDPWGLGSLQEILSKHANVNLGPAKIFDPGELLLINYPVSEAQSRESTTDFKAGSRGTWNIITKWKGASFSYNSENIESLSSREQYTSLPLLTNNVLSQPVVNQKVQGDIYTWITSLGLPFLVFRGLAGEVGRTFAVSGALYSFGIAVQVDPDYGKDVVCNKEELSSLVGTYVSWTIGLGLAQLAFDIAPALSIVSRTGRFAPYIDTVSRQVSTIQSWVNPLMLFQIYWGNKVMTYVSNCKDPQYKVLAYQFVDRAPAEKGTAQEAVGDVISSAQDLLSGAGLFKSTEESAKIDLEKMKEVLNFQVSVQDQEGYIEPPTLKRVHIDKSAWMIQGGLFERLNGTGCFFDENHVTSDGGVISIGRNGLKKVNKDGSVAFDFNSFYWKLRAASILRSQELARMIVPNTVLTTMLDCGDKPFITISSSGSSVLADANCPASDCLRLELKKLTNFDGASLEKVFGKIVSVDTTLGTAKFLGDSVSFTRFSVGSNAPSTETRAPTLEQAAKSAGLGSATAGVSLTVLGNGSVTLFSPKDFGLLDIGTLKTIIAEKGKIEYDPVVKRLYVFVYVLGAGQAQTINDVIARAGNVNSQGKNIPVVNLDLKGKTGFEDVVQQLRDALAKIQQDSQGGKGGVQILETPDKIYKFNPDGTLSVIDKKTGATETFKITGQPFTDANGNVVFPTDKGNISFGTGLNAQGQPIINVNGPGIKDSGVLEAAKGPGGIFTFNPSTGAITVYNGQDLPMDPRFATQGMSFIGTPEGTRGIPASNPFALPPSDEGSFQRRSPGIALPSWPTQSLWFAAMLAILLAGVLFVRTRRFEA